MGVDSNTDSKRKSPKHHHRRIQRWEEEEETLIRLLGSISPNPRSLINNNKLQKKSPHQERRRLLAWRERESLMIYTYWKLVFGEEKLRTWKENEMGFV
jgi:hypothetical protein